MMTIRSARIRAGIFSKMDSNSDNGGGSSSGCNENGSGPHELKRRRLIAGDVVSRSGPRTRAKLDNDMLMDDNNQDDNDQPFSSGENIDHPDNGYGLGPCMDNDNEENDDDHDDNENDSSSSSSSSESSESSDTDDSSEMDEEATEKRKVDFQADLADLEKQFLFLRELLYRERITHAHRTIDDVRAGKAREYLGPLESLQENMRIRIEVASIRRDLRIKTQNLKYDAEKLAITQNLESEKQLLYDSIKSDLEDRIHRLEQDRNNDFTTDYWLEPSFKKKNKKSIDLFGEKKKKPVTVSGPYIVYMLSDEDIMEDWNLLKKALNAPKRKFNGESALAY